MRTDWATPGIQNMPCASTKKPEANAWLAAIVESSDDAIVSKNINGIVTSWNGGAQRMFGFTADEIIGESILKLIPPDRHSEEAYILSQVRAGNRIQHYDTMRSRKDGQLLHVSLSISPIRDSSGAIVGISKIARDITAWKAANDAQVLLLQELNHRSKNLLAIVDAILRQTAKSTRPAELVNRVSLRLQALSLNQDILVANNWRGVQLAQIVRSQMMPLLGDVTSQVKVEGPDILVTPAAAQAIGMTIYELSVNALQYGALSVPGGHVHIAWTIADANGTREFMISWRETGGPATSAPKKKGFGSTIIENIAARSLLGKATVTYSATGLIWKLVAPETLLLNYVSRAIV